MNDSLLDTIFISQAEVPQLPLVKRFLKENGFRAQVAKTDVAYIVKHKQTIIGALRLCQYDSNWLLRSMCIKDSYRNMGIGRHLLSFIQPDLASKQCYCFAYSHLEKFYQQAGFCPVKPEQSSLVIRRKFDNYISRGKKILLMKFSA